MPNVGKSTLFNAITQAGAASANYPFCTIEPNVGIVSVPDARLDYLAEIYHPEKVYARYHRICGYCRPCEGSQQRRRAWEINFFPISGKWTPLCMWCAALRMTNITHVDGSVDPVRDMETINFELILCGYGNR